MDLRNLPEQLSGFQRVNQRRTLIEQELKADLRHTAPDERVIGEAEKKNCEQMFGVVALPVGYAGPLPVTFSNGEKSTLHLPLATTEGALIASANRGCKAIAASGSAMITQSKHHGISRSIAFRAGSASGVQELVDFIRGKETEWKNVAEATSGHLKILGYELDLQKQYVFLTIRADTDEAMGMNMVTIAAEAVARCVTDAVKSAKCITVAGNVDSDKKPSKRTHERGRGYEVRASVTMTADTIASILKSDAKSMLAVAKAKLDAGSDIAGAIGKNLHAANIVAALYLATGQDAAHVVEGSLADTTVEESGDGLKISVRLPAILVGIRGGGTALPSQNDCLKLLIGKRTGADGKRWLAESIAAAVLAGEISLLAAQASGQLGTAHATLGR